jgi:hypothetical protein
MRAAYLFERCRLAQESVMLAHGGSGGGPSGTKGANRLRHARGSLEETDAEEDRARRDQRDHPECGGQPTD